MPVLGDGECLYEGDIRLSYMSGCDKFRTAAEVHVDIADFTVVDSLAQGRIGLIRNALCDGAGFRQLGVNLRSHRGAGVKRNFNLTPILDLLRERMRHDLWITGIGKATDADGHAICNQARGIVRAHNQGQRSFAAQPSF